MSPAEEDTWRTVPQRDNLMRKRSRVETVSIFEATSRPKGPPEETYFVRVGSQRDSKRARKTKVGNLEVPALVNQEVLRLQVTVKDSSE